MREYKFYMENMLSYDKDLQEIGKNIENLVNSDSGLIEKAKKTNADFAAKIAKAMENPDNIPYMGTIIVDLQSKTPRYYYIKNIKHGEREYEAEVDLLNRYIVFYEA